MKIVNRNEWILAILFVMSLPFVSNAQDWEEHLVAGGFGGSRSVYAADIDNDGDMDLMGAAFADNDITWWENLDGEGLSWEEHIIEPDFGRAYSVHAADINGDNNIDVLGASYGEHKINWWDNSDGQGTFAVSHTIDGDFSGALDVYTCDMDNDGDIDVVGGSYSGDERWWENEDGTGLSWTAHSIGGGDSAYGIYPADIDDDEDIDILCAYYYSMGIGWWENIDGSGTSWSFNVICGTNNALSAYAIDLDQDGDLDVVGATADGVLWWDNTDGTGNNWEQHYIDESFDDAYEVYAVDIDFDGDNDVLGASHALNKVSLWINTYGTAGSWETCVISDDFSGAQSVYAVDVNNDMAIDIIGASYNAGEIAWWDNPLDPPEIQLISPNGGENWIVESNQIISWHLFYSSTVVIELLNNDELVLTIDTEAPSNENEQTDYEFAVPVLPAGDQYKIRVSTTYESSTFTDESDNTFSISGIQLLSPNGDEEWPVDSEQTISWYSTSSNPVTIELLDVNTVIFTINSEAPSNENEQTDYSFTVPAVPVNDLYKIRVSQVVDEETYQDESNRGFDITNPITLISPNGQEQWPVNSEQTISWHSTSSNPVTIELLEHDDFFITIDSEAPSNEDEQTNYVFTVPAVPVADYYNIRLTIEIDEITYECVSQFMFSITNPIDLLMPNGGEQYLFGETVNITWTSLVDSPIRIDLYHDAQFETRITNNTDNDGVYNWSIPPLEGGSGYRIHISTTINEVTYSDVSDGTFSIELPGIVLDEIVSDTVRPCFVNVIYRARTQSDESITFLGDLAFYEILENNDEISETESIPTIGQVETLPFEQRTVLMLDNSFSIGLDLPLVKEAAKTAVRNQFTNQHFSVWTFSENVTEIQPFTTDTTALIAAIDGITLGPASTNLYGAVVTGTEQLETYFSMEGIVQSSMVLLTDGEDTQGSTSEQSAINAVQGEQVFTIGVGDDADAEILQQLGTAGYSEGSYEELTDLFTAIQQEIEDYANSFYWLVYISPNRNNSNVQLDLSLPSNPINSTITVHFSSVGFSSVDPGVYVNRDFNELLGIEEYNYEGSLWRKNFKAETLFNLYDPYYQWSIENEEYARITWQWGDQNEHVYLTAMTDEPFTTYLTVEDTENNYSKTIVISSSGLGVDELNDTGIPGEFNLAAAYPNPFNPSTTFNITLPVPSNLSVHVFNIRGQLVETIHDDWISPGTHSFDFNASQLSSGIYFVRAQVPGTFCQARKIVLIK